MDIQEISDLTAEYVMGECRHDWEQVGPNFWNYRCLKCGRAEGNLLIMKPSLFPKVGNGMLYAKESHLAWRVVQRMLESERRDAFVQAVDEASGLATARTHAEQVMRLLQWLNDPKQICLTALNVLGISTPVQDQENQTSEAITAF